MTCALKNEITIKDGRVEQQKFADRRRSRQRRIRGDGQETSQATTAPDVALASVLARMIGVAATISVAVYVIIELEYPRLGFGAHR